MQNLAPRLDADAATQLAGWITASSRAGGRLTLSVRAQGSVYDAQRAASCLVEPAVGDRVLLAALGDGTAYVLAVLDRAAETPLPLSVDGDVTMRARGALGIVGEQGATITTGGTLGLASAALDVKTVEARLGFSRLVAAGAEVFGDIARSKIVAGALDLVAERIHQRVARSYRNVSELDQVRAKRVDYVAETTLRMHGENAVVTADELVKMDGANIHVG